MNALIAMVCGVVCGIVAATPLLVQLRGEEPDLGQAFGFVIVAFLAIQLAMFAVHAWWPGHVADFGVPAALTLLACVVVGVLRSPWRG